MTDPSTVTTAEILLVAAHSAKDGPHGLRHLVYAKAFKRYPDGRVAAVRIEWQPAMCGHRLGKEGSWDWVPGAEATCRYCKLWEKDNT